MDLENVFIKLELSFTYHYKLLSIFLIILTTHDKKNNSTKHGLRLSLIVVQNYVFISYL